MPVMLTLIGKALLTNSLTAAHPGDIDREALVSTCIERANLANSGFLIVDKPAGPTCQQMVSRVRRLFGTKKVGHAGTLDPMATGVLIVGVNRATKLLGQLILSDKRYLATIRFGQATDTDDADGQPVATVDASHLTLAAVEKAVGNFVGDIMQVPSSVSAIKINGQRCYAKARAGQEVKLAPRPVTVTRFDVLSAQKAPAEITGGEFFDVSVDVECSSGTYIRALARDLGQLLGVGAHLTMLRRTRVGGFSIEQAQVLPEWEDIVSNLAALPVPMLLSLAEIAKMSLECIEVTPEDAYEIIYGRPLNYQISTGPVAMLYQNQLLALYQPGAEAGQCVPVSVLCPAAT